MWQCGLFTDDITTLGLYWVTLGCGNFQSNQHQLLQQILRSDSSSTTKRQYIGWKRVLLIDLDYNDTEDFIPKLGVTELSNTNNYYH